MRVRVEALPGILESGLHFRDTEAAEFVSSLRKRSVVDAGPPGDGARGESIRLCHLLEVIFDALEDKRRILIDRLRRNFTEALGVDAVDKGGFRIASLVEVLKKDYIVKGDVIVVNGTEFNITDGEMYEALVTRTELDEDIRSERFAECIYEILYDGAAAAEHDRPAGGRADADAGHDRQAAVASLLARNQREEEGLAVGSKYGELQGVLLYRVLRCFASRMLACLVEQRDGDEEDSDPALIRYVEGLHAKLARRRPGGKQDDLLREYAEVFAGV